MNTQIIDKCPRPFKGLILCATGLLDKPTLFKQAVELGATSTTAFTDTVTHLIAADHGGAKYTCALERKIPILQPSWVSDCYQTWLRGDDVDLQNSIQQHRLPIFSNVILSLSGINDITRRTQINKIITQHSGLYVKNLERPVKVTHLLCSGDEETEKMRYAEKFNSRGEANIHIVWEEWFWDSLEFGGRFGEERYRVVHPRPERKLTDTDGQPPHSNTLTQAPASPTSTPKKPDDTQDEPELAALKNRVPAFTLNLWASLLKPRGFEVTNGKLVLSPSKRPLLPHHTAPPRDASPPHSIISSFRRANSFVDPPNADTTTALRPFRRTQTLPLAPSRAPGLFTGLTFRALGEAKSANVREAIDAGGGRMVSDDQHPDYIIVRLVSGSKFYRDDTDPAHRARYRTECWLERCIFEERVCAPHEHVSFTPLAVDTPVRGAEGVSLSFSGLDQSEACWTRRLVRALGIDLAPNFSRRTTHLLCPAGVGAKFDKAREWGVPVVGMGWLAETAASGTVPGVGSHLVGDGGAVAHDAGVRDGGGGDKDKGKGRADAGGDEDGGAHAEFMSSFGRPSALLARVPSSTSPSPMKLPPHASSASAGASAGSSPVRGADETRALQESIASLLGKRSPSGGDAAGGRAGKRVRPLAKGKGKAQELSRAESSEGTGGSEVPRSLSPFGAGEEVQGGERGKGEGMRVVYEDPGQREEKRRLVSLLEGQVADRAGGARGVVRRSSTRVAGF